MKKKRKIFYFGSLLCIRIGVNQILSVLWKKKAYPLTLSQLCESIYKFFFSNQALMRSKANERPLSQSKGRRKRQGDAERRGKERAGSCLTAVLLCVFSQHQQQGKWNRAAKYANGTMRQRVWSSCRAQPSPGPWVWNAEDRLRFVQEEVTERTHCFSDNNPT